MSDSKEPAGSSGFFNLFTIFVAAIAILLTAMVILFMPAEAKSDEMAPPEYSGPSGYFPDEFVNQGKAIQPVEDYTY